MPTVRPLTVPLALALVDPPACQLITDATRVADGASADGHDGAGALSDGAAIAAHDGADYAGTAIAARDGRNGGDGTGPAGRIVAAVNFTSDPMTLGLPDGQPERATLMMSTDPDRAVGDADLRRFVLLPSEAVLLLMPVVAATATRRLRGPPRRSRICCACADPPAEPPSPHGSRTPEPMRATGTLSLS